MKQTPEDKLVSSSIDSSLDSTISVLSFCSVSSILLILANLIPLAGVLLFHWNIGEIMLLFWLESAIIGFYNILKMFTIGGWSALSKSFFFCLHYGGFMVAHLLFIFSFFIEGSTALTPAEGFPLAQALEMIQGLWVAILGLIISHGFSYLDNFLRKQEYQGKALSKQMQEPYKRIIIMQLTVILGGVLVLKLGTPLAALVLLLLIKIAIDLKAHIKQRENQPGLESSLDDS